MLKVSVYRYNPDFTPQLQKITFVEGPEKSYQYIHGFNLSDEGIILAITEDNKLIKSAYDEISKDNKSYNTQSWSLEPIRNACIAKGEEINLNITDLGPHSNESVWIGTSTGLIYFNYGPGKGKKVNCYHKNSNLQGRISSNFITDIYRSKSDNLWVSTYEGGLNYADLNQKEFYNLSSISNKGRELINTSHIRAIHEDSDQNLWLGTAENGVIRYIHKEDQLPW